MTNIINRAADYSASSRFLPPAASPGYFALYPKGGLGRNLSGGDATLVGSPVKDAAGYARFTGTSGLVQTPVAETMKMTLVFAGRMVAQGFAQGILIGDYTNASTAAVALYTTLANRISYSVGVTSGGAAAVSSGNITEDATAWGIRALRVDGAGVRYDNLTTGGQLDVAVANRRAGSALIRVGGGYNSSFVGANEQIMAGVWTRRLSDAELLGVAELARVAGSQVGVTF